MSGLIILNREAAYLAGNWMDIATAIGLNYRVLNDTIVFLVYEELMSTQQSLCLEGITHLTSVVNLITFMTDLLNREDNSQRRKNIVVTFMFAIALARHRHHDTV